MCMSRLSKERGGNWNWRELSECWYCSHFAFERSQTQRSVDQRLATRKEEEKGISRRLWADDQSSQSRSNSPCLNRLPPTSWFHDVGINSLRLLSICDCCQLGDCSWLLNVSGSDCECCSRQQSKLGTYIPWDHWSNCIPTNPEILPSGYSNEDDCKVLLTRRDPHATKCVASVSACNKKRPIGNQVCCLCERLEYSLTMDNVTSLFNKVVRMQESQLSDVLWTLRDAVILASVSSLNTL